MVVGRWPGWRVLWCPARLSFQLDILRLITRGLLRGLGEQVALDLSQGPGQEQ